MKDVYNQETIHVVGAAIIRNGRCLITRRSETMSAPLKWEFPGGKVEAGETPEHALERELHEELDLTIRAEKFIGRGHGHIDKKHIILDVYAATLIKGDIKLSEHHEYGWFGPEELETLDWPEADWPILPHLRDYMLKKKE